MTVTAAEEADRDGLPTVIYASKAARQNAGRHETYLVTVTADALRKANIPVPADLKHSAHGAIERLKQERESAQMLAQSVQSIAAEQFANDRSVVAKFDQHVKPSLHRLLSKIPQHLVQDDHIVQPGESVIEKNLQAMQRGIATTINRSDPPSKASIVGHITLTEEQKDLLASFLDGAGNYAHVPPAVMEPLLYGAAHVSSGSRTRDNASTTLCRPQSQMEQSASRLLGIVPEPANPVPDSLPPPAGVVAAPDDVAVYVTRLTAPISPPEDSAMLILSQSEQRADQETVQQAVHDFGLQPGPADAPALHDFHNLQIAFADVWEEAIDARVLNAAANVYGEYVKVDPSGLPDPFLSWMLLPPPVLTATTTFGAFATVNVPPAVLKAFQITEAQWCVLDEAQRGTLSDLAGRLTADSDKVWSKTTYMLPSSATQGANTLERKAFEEWRVWGERIIAHAKHKVDAAKARQPTTSPGEFTRLHQLLRDLHERLRENYAFTIYAANPQERSVNFGIVVTYRQQWVPKAYQAGELVKTIPLAPRESRKFSKKVVVKKSRAEKETDNALQSRKSESGETFRAESDILRKAETTTNFSLTAEGSYNIGISKGTSKSALTQQAATLSQDVKKDFHEAVFKAAEEYRQERNVEIRTDVSDEAEVLDSGEITNPNDELTVTFLFYELQRCYRVFEHLHKVTPVVLVAQEMPRPEDVDEDWLVAHDWILRRALLDDSFRPALDYLSSGVVGDEYAVEEMRENVERQRHLLDALQEEVVAIREQLGRRYGALETAFENRAVEAGREAGGGLLGSAADYLFGSGGNADETARLREEAAKDAYERAAREEKETKARLEREVTALMATTEAYTNAVRDHLSRKEQIIRLRTHVKQNILYYMQAIWDSEHTDQRFFRLHQVQVPVLTGSERSYTILATPNPKFIRPYPYHKQQLFPVVVDRPVTVPVAPEMTTLAACAELDNLLGYKGNYMIFPLKQSNALTDHMMLPYIDAVFGIHDPDEFGNWTPQQFAEYVHCLRARLGDAEFATLTAQLKDEYTQLLTAPRRVDEEIVVPTGSLFIEALPGQHPILEGFKLMPAPLTLRRHRRMFEGLNLRTCDSPRGSCLTSTEIRILTSTSFLKERLSVSHWPNRPNPSLTFASIASADLVEDALDDDYGRIRSRGDYTENRSGTDSHVR